MGPGPEEGKNEPTHHQAEHSQIQPATRISQRISPLLSLSLSSGYGSTAAALAGLHRFVSRLPGPACCRAAAALAERGRGWPRGIALTRLRFASGYRILRRGSKDPVAVGGEAGRMDREDQRLRRALAAFGGDVWALVDAALAAAARDRPEELRARRDGFIERLYAGGGCSNCEGHPPRTALAAARLEEEDEGEAAAAAAAVSPEAEADADADRVDEADELGGGDGDDGLESKILAIRDLLEDPEQPEDELVSLLQNLANMDVTYKALQETDIGRHVNGLRKHSSGEVRRLVKQLIRKWKEIVDDWVRLHNIGGDGGSALITDGDSPDKIQGRNHQSPRVSEFKYSPSPQRHNGSSSERANNGFGSTMDVKRRASPVPTYQNSRQINNNHHHSTTSSSAPAKMARDHKDSLLDLEVLDRLDSARKRLQENYQEAQNARKQRTIQVMDINEIPKPKNRNTFIRKSGSGGLPARHG